MSLQDSMVVTDQRVLFLWRRWLCGMSLVSCEESFYLDDLQVLTKWISNSTNGCWVTPSIGRKVD
jgi:hypothetical protein